MCEDSNSPGEPLDFRQRKGQSTFMWTASFTLQSGLRLTIMDFGKPLFNLFFKKKKILKSSFLLYAPTIPCFAFTNKLSISGI